MPSLLQCEHNIKKYFPNAKIQEYFDSVASSKLVKETGDKSLACISPEGVGETYGLVRIKKDYLDFKLIKSELKTNKIKSEVQYKTSVMFTGVNISGFLFKALGCFSLRDINLSKIESRPIPKSPWNYYFYLDFEGKYDEENVINAINNLKEISPDVKVLGSYVAGKI